MREIQSESGFEIQDEVLDNQLARGLSAVQDYQLTKKLAISG